MVRWFNKPRSFIKWGHYISNEELLARACVEDIEILSVRSRIRWLGHVARMEDDRPVKSLLYGELTKGARPVGRQKLRYKDTCKSALKCGDELGQWKAKVENRTEWRHDPSNMQQSEREESECI